MKFFVITLLGIYFILYIFFSYPKRNFIRNFLKSAIFGVLTLSFLHVFSGLFELSIPLNIYTIGLSALFGAPGIIVILLFPFIFI